MRENINKVSQRGERLDSLQDKTDNLAVSAQGFRRGANRVRKDMWWKDMKMRVCLVVCIIILLVVIIVPGKSILAGSALAAGEEELTSIDSRGHQNLNEEYESVLCIGIGGSLCSHWA